MSDERYRVDIVRETGTRRYIVRARQFLSPEKARNNARKLAHLLPDSVITNVVVRRQNAAGLWDDVGVLDDATFTGALRDRDYGRLSGEARA